MLEKLRKEKLHFSLIDPDKQSPKQAGEMARKCQKYGTDAIMVGGSTISNRNIVYETINEIKKACSLPTILFPNSANAVAENADYIFFMDLLNSLEYKYRKGEQIKGALLVKKWGIKPIPTGYIIISTSNKLTTVEKKVKLDVIKAEDIEKAVQYSIYAECIGLKCIYLEAGSNADKPVPDEMIKEIRKEIEIPIIVGGGINEALEAKRKIIAGANAIVNGTLIEKNIDRLEEIIKAIKSTSPI